MPINLVSGADVTAISIVGKGANRKRFFLTKADGDAAQRLPGVERIVKADDWSAVYCVVAEPDWHESPGSAPGTDQAIEDRWASEDEIRKAAHRFMANGGLVTKMHESLEPFGQLVENAVALDDFTIDGEVIRKGSWYIAIEPTADGNAAIDNGEFTGVSIEGLATRELVEKHSFRSIDNTHPMEVQPMSPTLDLTEPWKPLAEAIVKGLGLPTAQEKADAAEDRLAKKIATQLREEAAPSTAERWTEAEGLDPALAGVFGPGRGAVDAAVRQAVAKDDPTQSAELRKAYEDEGMAPALAELF
jgi:hypothetical protein